MKLNPDDLDVMSFETEADQAALAPTIIVNPNEPTPATFCRICPEGTGDCY